MVPNHCKKVGIQAGLLAGASLVALFFLLDLVRLQPLATPFALGGQLFGPGGPLLDTPVLSQFVAVTMYAGNLLTLAILLFLAFAFLGVGAVWGCKECGIRLNIATGALYGLTVGSLVFYACLSLGGEPVIVNSPGPLTVALTNLTAGAVMGGFAQFAQPRHS